MILLLPPIDVNIFAAITAAGGAIFIKIIEKWLSRRSENAMEAERIRDELRKEIARLRDDNIRLTTEVGTWHQKYWDVKNQKDSDEILIASLKSEISDGIERIQKIERVINSDRQDISDLEIEIEELRQTFKRLSEEN